LDTGELLANKHFHIGENPTKVEKEFFNYKREVLVLKQLNHPNVIRYYQTDLSPTYEGVDVILEFMPGGSLKTIL